MYNFGLIIKLFVHVVNGAYGVYGVGTITYLILVIIQLSMCLFFCIAATCQPCTTCLHIPLLYIPAYLNI